MHQKDQEVVIHPEQKGVFCPGCGAEGKNTASVLNKQAESLRLPSKCRRCGCTFTLVMVKDDKRDATLKDLAASVQEAIRQCGTDIDALAITIQTLVSATPGIYELQDPPRIEVQKDKTGRVFLIPKNNSALRMFDWIQQEEQDIPLAADADLNDPIQGV